MKIRIIKCKPAIGIGIGWINDDGGYGLVLHLGHLVMKFYIKAKK